VHWKIFPVWSCLASPWPMMVKPLCCLLISRYGRDDLALDFEPLIRNRLRNRSEPAFALKSTQRVDGSIRAARLCDVSNALEATVSSCGAVESTCEFDANDREETISIGLANDCDNESSGEFCLPKVAFSLPVANSWAGVCVTWKWQFCT